MLQTAHFPLIKCGRFHGQLQVPSGARTQKNPGRPLDFLDFSNPGEGLWALKKK